MKILTEIMAGKSKIILAAAWLLILILNAAAWISESFCDWYRSYIFPIWLNSYGRLTALAPFSVGEVMLIFACLLLLVAIVMGICGVVWKKSRDVCKRFYGVLGWIVTCVTLVMTLNCTMLYHCSAFKVNILGEDKQEYTLEELTILRDYLVQKTNALAEAMPRDDAGRVIYQGDMNEEARRSMQKMGLLYPQMAGFYPDAKEIYNSWFLSQQYMQGYYFPFSLEANINSMMYVMNKPTTICHELAHLKGYIYEDEANFIGYLACVNSDDMVFKYSGYLGVIGYLDNDYYRSIGKDDRTYKQHPQIGKKARKDMEFLTEDAWKVVEQTSVLETEKVKQASNRFTDQTLKINGVQDGMASYGRVVQLLLDYYDGVLY